MACITLCAAVVENIYLKSICIDGNPIGNFLYLYLLRFYHYNKNYLYCNR
jgi:hypothetical protein